MRVRARAIASLVLFGALVLSSAATSGTYTLSDVTLAQMSGEVTLEVTADQTVRYDLFRLENPDRVVLDLIDAERPIEPTVRGESAPSWVEGIRTSVWRDDPNGRIVRYVVETTQPVEYTVAAEKTRLLLHLTAPTTAQPPVKTTPTRLMANQSEPLDTAPPFGKVDPSYEITAMEISSSQTNPTGGGAPMNLDVQGADIRTVLRSISEFSKINIIPDRDVSGPISVKVVQVPWRHALDLVCESAAVSVVERGEVLRVASRNTLMQEELERDTQARKREEYLPLETEVFPVRYATADELRQAVMVVLSKRGSVQVDDRTNSLIVTDFAERIEQIGGLVKSLDTETLQVEIVAKLVDLDITASRQLGISWNANNLHSTGERMSASIAHESPLATATTTMNFGVVRDWANIDAAIQAMERENKANIISNPSVTTVNNRKARILVGKEVPLIILDESGNPITELKKVGITLEVTPYINSANQVTMDIHPEVSDLSSQATVQGGIVFNTTEADTRVMVADGETAVIGGLIRTNETTFQEGVPFLRSIPILGHLFRSTDVRKDRRELLIFITPRIVEGMASNQG